MHSDVLLVGDQRHLHLHAFEAPGRPQQAEQQRRRKLRAGSLQAFTKTPEADELKSERMTGPPYSRTLPASNLTIGPCSFNLTRKSGRATARVEEEHTSTSLARSGGEMSDDLDPRSRGLSGSGRRLRNRNGCCVDGDRCRMCRNAVGRRRGVLTRSSMQVGIGIGSAGLRIGHRHSDRSVVAVVGRRRGIAGIGAGRISGRGVGRRRVCAGGARRRVAVGGRGHGRGRGRGRRGRMGLRLWLLLLHLKHGELLVQFIDLLLQLGTLRLLGRLQRTLVWLGLRAHIRHSPGAA